MEGWMLNPYVRYMDQRMCFMSYPRPVLAYDYRLFAVCAGYLILETPDHQMPLNKHDIIVLPPALPYRLLFDGQQPAQLYDINFSLSYLPARPMAPVEEKLFIPARMPEAPDDQLFPTPCRFPQHEALCAEVGQLLAVYESGGRQKDALCSALLKAILLRLLIASEASAPAAAGLPGRVAAYLEAHCRERLTAAQLGREFGYHPYYLNRIFREATGTTLHRYQMDCRIRRAQTMLRDTGLSIGEIAESLGFAPGPYFSELFRQTTGLSPTEYRGANH